MLVTSPVVELRAPCHAEYVSVVRLAVLGLCGRAPLSYDEVEDLRLAVGEGCASSVQRAAEAGMDDARLTLRATVDESLIVLEIEDDVPVPPASEPLEQAVMDVDFNDQQFRVSLMQLLVDEVNIEGLPGGGQCIRLTKHCVASDGQ